MRELIAILVCVAALFVAVGSSLVFAARHNAAVPSIEISKKPDQTTIAQPSPSTVGTSPPVIPAPAPLVATSPPTPAASATPPATTVAPVVPTPGREPGAAGLESIKTLGCLTCHSIAGTGNPRHPLDGVGSQWTAEQLHAWITGSGFAAERLPASVTRRKQRYTSIPEPEMNALISCLSELKATQPGK